MKQKVTPMTPRQNDLVVKKSCHKADNHIFAFLETVQVSEDRVLHTFGTKQRQFVFNDNPNNTLGLIALLRNQI